MAARGGFFAELTFDFIVYPIEQVINLVTERNSLITSFIRSNMN